MEKLRYLEFYDMKLKDKNLEEMVAALPSLKVFFFFNLVCCEFYNLHIGSQSLKNFFLIPKERRSHCLTIQLDAPNLVRFKFTGCPSIHLSLNSTKMWRADVELCHVVSNIDSFTALILFFEELRSAEKVNLWAYSKEVTILNNFRFHHKNF